MSNTGKLYHVYHDSSLDTSQLKVLDQAKLPIWRVTTNAFSTTLKLKSAGNHQTTLAAARFHSFSSDVDICLGDPDVGETSFFDVLTRDPAFVHYRHRWGMDVSHLPAEMTQRYAASVGGQNRLQFMWRRPGDSVWVGRDWEMIIDDGGGSAGTMNAVVLARFQSVRGSWKKKGRLYMEEGWGERWELMTAITAFAVLEKERVRNHR
ncbi:hypothetical protein EX30DRAFT_367716 [Ascodesmis nigricans]|uniref:Uncharacterized protein n=1 Tax=Ascodesmis nigricans TaxID=341454 RepID=A0A4S2N5Z2_9PEZI|nr:hypothetical protein EX30DRAFT_367716 [Ascodesmis nigricans]